MVEGDVHHQSLFQLMVVGLNAFIGTECLKRAAPLATRPAMVHSTVTTLMRGERDLCL